VELVVLSKKEQVRVVCKNQTCSSCLEFELLNFNKTGSTIQFIADIPDYNNNEEMLHDQTLVVDVLR
jgi:hypothetical protein